MYHGWSVVVKTCIHKPVKTCHCDVLHEQGMLHGPWAFIRFSIAIRLRQQHCASYCMHGALTQCIWRTGCFHCFTYHIHDAHDGAPGTDSMAEIHGIASDKRTSMCLWKVFIACAMRVQAVPALQTMLDHQGYPFDPFEGFFSLFQGSCFDGRRLDQQQSVVSPICLNSIKCTNALTAEWSRLLQLLKYECTHPVGSRHPFWPWTVCCLLRCIRLRGAFDTATACPARVFVHDGKGCFSLWSPAHRIHHPLLCAALRFDPGVCVCRSHSSS